MIENFGQGSGVHVLLVDDDPIFRSLTRLSLLQLGHSVLVASDSKSALKAAAENTDIQLLIVDVIMPGMNGMELAAKFRAILPCCKALYVSGYPAATPGVMSAPADTLHFLQKPFRREDLDRCIQAVLAGN